MQFTYGDDGLHPDKMENNDRPVDFNRLRLHVSQIAPCLDEESLPFDSLMGLVEKKLQEDPFKSLERCFAKKKSSSPVSGSVFLQEIRDFFSSIGAEEQSVVGKRLTETQLGMILQSALEKFLLAFVEPGEACGAMGAQSISEPGTQMTLKVRVCGQEQLLHLYFSPIFLLSHLFFCHRLFTLAGSHP